MASRQGGWLSQVKRYFEFERYETNLRRETLGGLTTFLTMSYILVVQPAILSGEMFGFSTGIDHGALITATAISAAVATLIMGLYARYPIALAPGMGQNFFFVFSVLPAAAAIGITEPWRAGLGVVFLSGILFFLVSLTGLRRVLIDLMSDDLKHAIAVGIGLFIAFIGLQNAGLIERNPATGVSLNHDLLNLEMAIFSFGLLVTAALMARGRMAAILWGLLSATALALLLRWTLPLFLPEALLSDWPLFTAFQPAGALFSLPPSLAPTFLAFDLNAALLWQMIPFILIFLFMDIFDTTGTLIGVSERTSLLQNGRLERAERAFLADATGTVAGAVMGNSTVTSFIESSTGVAQGARTGFASVVTALLFLAALFFSPILTMIGSYAPLTAPALVAVGTLMAANVTQIRWSDPTESIPAFIIILGIPLSFSIADGIALGCILYPILKLMAGRRHEVHPLFYLLAAVLLAYLLLVRSQI